MRLASSTEGITTAEAQGRDTRAEGYSPIILGKISRPPYPAKMMIDIHSFCNARCVMCPYEHLSKRLTMGRMKKDLYEKILDDYKALTEYYSVKGNVTFCTMAEPFADECVLERADSVLRRGFKLYFNTNASMMFPYYVDALLGMGFKGRFVLNIPAVSPEIYTRLTGLNIENTLANAEYLIQHYSRDKIVAEVNVVDQSLKELCRVRDYWKARNIKVDWILPNSRAGLLAPFSSRQPPKVMVCSSGRPLKQMVVTFEGEVLLCCQDMGRKCVVGKLTNQSVAEVWNGDMFRGILEKIYLPPYDGLDLICRDCIYALSASSIFTRLSKNIRYETRKAFRVLGRIYLGCPFFKREDKEKWH